MLIVDAHLDLSYNHFHGRKVLGPAVEQQPDKEGIPTVGLPDLRRGGVGLVCATVFIEPASRNSTGYTTYDEAHATALRHLEWYQKEELAGEFNLIRHTRDLDAIDPNRHAISAILLLEGSDAIRSPNDVPFFYDAGVRIVGMAWKQTRHAGGTGAPGPLTKEGVELVPALDRAGIIHDVSHLAEESFWQLVKLTDRPVIASHSNCRKFVPTDRQLSDDMIRAIVDRGGVIGINYFDRFLLEPSVYGTRRAKLDDVVRHMQHIVDLTKSTDHIAIGTDMDGGLGREQIPQEVTTSADLVRLVDPLRKAGFGESDVEKIMNGNWLRFFRQNLR